MLAHAAGGISLSLPALKAEGGEREEKRPVKSVYVWEEQRRAEERPVPEMCQRSLVPPGPGHQPRTTGGGRSSVCEEQRVKQREEGDSRKTSPKTQGGDKSDTG